VAVGLDTPPEQLRSAFAMLLGEHMELIVDAQRATFAGSPEFEAAAAQVNANTATLAKAMGGIVGPEKAAEFQRAWANHVEGLMAYTSAVAGKDEAGKTVAKENLDGFAERLAHGPADAAGVVVDQLARNLRLLANSPFAWVGPLQVLLAGLIALRPPRPFDRLPVWIRRVLGLGAFGSLLLILLGLVTFVVFLTDPSANRWSEAGKLIGATLFQVGAVTLLLELVHLERLLGSKVPEALLDHGYLDNLKDDRLDDLIERVIRARFEGPVTAAQIEAALRPLLA
jgi:hypothetical protein